jgi:hypothetical protein
VIHVLLSFSGDKDVDGRAFASPKGLRPRRRVKPGHDVQGQIEGYRSSRASKLEVPSARHAFLQKNPSAGSNNFVLLEYLRLSGVAAIGADA